MPMTMLDHLRREARHCREIAARVSLSSDVEALIRLALRYEAKAAELEAGTPDRSPKAGASGASGRWAPGRGEPSPGANPVQAESSGRGKLLEPNKELEHFS